MTYRKIGGLHFIGFNVGGISLWICKRRMAAMQFRLLTLVAACGRLLGNP